MPEYFTMKRVDTMPRLPLEGGLDLTYRCNNNCRHCWVRIAPGAPESSQELTFDEIRGIVDQARVLGTREWAISGGEPMLRQDFAEVFDYLTRKSTTYSLNTNGTLITSKIARLLKRKGTKMIAVYGATAEVNDHITRNPGSFEATLRGMAYLREAGAGFIVQLIPMKDNYHQWQAMIELAQSLQPRTGAAAPPGCIFQTPARRKRTLKLPRSASLPLRSLLSIRLTCPSRSDWRNSKPKRSRVVSVPVTRMTACLRAVLKCAASST